MSGSHGFQLHAWVDESMRTENVAAPIYMLGAAIADPTGCEGMRDELRRLLPAGRKLHWRDMDEHAKKASTTVLSGFDAAHMVVVATPLNPKKQERARAACMEMLFYQLGAMGVTLACLESRGKHLDRKDLQLVERLRGKRSMPATLRIETGLPSLEPMLWIPDQILGAYGAAESGDDQWLGNFAATVERIDVEL